MRRLPSSSGSTVGDLSNAAGERQFEAWVRGRLSTWSAREIQAFDRWLHDESLYEFVPAVRAASIYKRLEEAAQAGPEERAV